MNNEEIFKVFTEEQQKILANIVETYIDEVDEKLKNLNENDDWEAQIKEYLGAYYLVLRCMEFASVVQLKKLATQASARHLEGAQLRNKIEKIDRFSKGGL